MACTDVEWQIKVAGDVTRRRVTISRADSNVPSGVTITKGWLTVKADLADADGAALVQKEITVVNAPGTGEIENDGTGDVDFVVRFDLSRTDTLAIGVASERLVSAQRYFDVQVLASDGNPYTAEIGRVWCCRAEVTQATS